jgi:hypothetical protein
MVSLDIYLHSWWIFPCVLMFFAPHDPQLTNVSPTFHRSGVVFLDMARNEIGPQGFELMCSALATRQIRDGCWQQGTREKKTLKVSCLHVDMSW